MPIFGHPDRTSGWSGIELELLLMKSTIHRTTTSHRTLFTEL
jgi:hypothetical protein